MRVHDRRDVLRHPTPPRLSMKIYVPRPRTAFEAFIACDEKGGAFAPQVPIASCLQHALNAFVNVGVGKGGGQKDRSEHTDSVARALSASPAGNLRDSLELQSIMRVRFGDCLLDTSSRELTRSGVPVALTPK